VTKPFFTVMAAAVCRLFFLGVLRDNFKRISAQSNCLSLAYRSVVKSRRVMIRGSGWK